MKKSYIKILGLEAFMIFAIIINVLIFKKFQTTNTINSIMWSLTNIILFILIGLEKDKSLYKIDTMQIVFVYSFIYFLFTYCIGIFTGFNRTPYSLTFVNIIKNITPIILLIILQEIFRNNIAKKCIDNKMILYSMILILICLDLMTSIGYYSLETGLDVFEVIGILILPSIINNIILTFITLKSGYYPTILFRIFNECLIFMVPIVPDLNVYLESVLKIVFPTILFLKFNTLYAKGKFTKIKRKNITKVTINVSIAVVCATIIILVSGVFKYYAMAIGSNSMYPKIKKGDAVIIERTNSNIEYKKNMIIAYKHDKKVIVHRIYTITFENNKYTIVTKGDNNDSKDNWQVDTNEIIGIVKGKVPFVGWPSVILSETF